MKLLLKSILAITLLLGGVLAAVQLFAISAIGDLIKQAQRQQRPLTLWHDTLDPSSLTSSQDPTPVIFVGKNWQGSITVIALEGYQKLGVIDGIPDKPERLQDIRGQFIGRVFYYGIRQLVGEGNDQFVDAIQLSFQ